LAAVASPAPLVRLLALGLRCVGCSTRSASGLFWRSWTVASSASAPTVAAIGGGEERTGAGAKLEARCGNRVLDALLEPRGHALREARESALATRRKSSASVRHDSQPAR
jgi:hypothetical protein